MRLKVRLRRVETVSFRYSEKTLFMQLGEAFRRSLKWNDCVCFVSKSGDMVQFVWGEDNVKTGNRVWPVLSSAKLRLEKRNAFSGLMLGNYAAKGNLEIEGLKLFQEHFTKAATKPARKAKAKAKAPAEERAAA